MNERIVDLEAGSPRIIPGFTVQRSEIMEWVNPSRLRPFQLFLKYTLDRLFGIICLILVSPLLLLTALTVRVSLGSPVMFPQHRVGLKGRIFRIYKFRTMRAVHDAHGRLLPDALRTTRLGNLLRRAKLDELPQLLQVLSGDMSLIGPRPFMPYPEDARDVQPGIHYALPSGGTPLDVLRRQMKPGITGWCQVNGNTRFSLSDRMKFDAWYLRNYSLRLDLRILVMTLRVLLKGERVNPLTLEVARGELPPHWRRSALEGPEGIVKAQDSVSKIA